MTDLEPFKQSLPAFTSNYPYFETGRVGLLPTPLRTGALPAYTGRGVTIAFVDSGFYAHRDLAGRIKAHVDATTDAIRVDHRVLKSEAFSWHGQMTTVIACGDGTVSNGRYRGIASGAELVLVKISSPHNHVKEADILRGLNWLLANHRRYNVRVVNLSVGGDYVSYDPYHQLHRIVRDLTEQGVTVIAAAGNSNLDYLMPPASAAEAITVGGVDDGNTTDRRDWSLYSHNVGMAYDGSPKPDLLAQARWIASPVLPGTQVALEAFWLGALLCDDDDATCRTRQLLRDGRADRGLRRLYGQGFNPRLYDTLQERIHRYKLVDAHHQHVDGTSVAAPIVSAVVAQMLEIDPTLTPHEIKHILTATATPLPHEPLDRQGAGVLDAAKAVKRVLRKRPS